VSARESCGAVAAASVRRRFGVVVPIPTLPVSIMRNASVSVPARSVENARSPFPVKKFCWRIPVIADVVVPVLLTVSCVLKERREAVEVAEARLER